MSERRFGDAVFNDAGGLRTFARYYEVNSLARASLETIEAAAVAAGGDQRELFTTQEHLESTYGRNASYWLRDLTNGLMTGVSVWNDYDGEYRGGTAVAPDTLVGAKHYTYPVGTTVRFVDASNTVVERTISDARNLTQDITVYRLSSDLPAGIAPFKILPTGWETRLYSFANYYTIQGSYADDQFKTGDTTRDPLGTPTDFGPAVVSLNQFRQASTQRLLRRFHYLFFTELPANASTARYDLGESVIEYDSGLPAFLIVDDELVLMSTWTGVRIGTSAEYMASEIQAAMIAMGSPHTLTRADLSGYVNYTSEPAGGVAMSSYLTLPGLGTANASTPNAAPLQLTSNIDIRVKIRATDYTPTATQYIAAKRDSSTGEGEWALGIAGGVNTGKLIFSWYDVDQNALTGISSVVTGTTDGTDIWFRAIRGDFFGDYNVAFYTSPDGVTWTQLGESVYVVGLASPVAATGQAVRIGALNNQLNPFTGRVYNVDVKSGVNGTSVLTIDFTAQTPGATSFAAATGQTITINGTASIGADAPVLSSPTGEATGQTTATVGATTDVDNGTLYAVVTTSSSAPSAAQVVAGQDAAGAAAAFAGSVAVGSTGAKTIDATGLAAGTAYYAHLVQRDTIVQSSNVVSSASFETDPASATVANLGSLAAPYGYHW